MTNKTDNERNIYISWMIWLFTGIVDYLNTSAIYIGYITPALSEVFKQTLQFVFFPVYAVNTAIYAGLAAYNLFKDRDKKTDKVKPENIVRLLVNIASTAIVTTAVIGTLAFSATMGVACTFLFAINLGLTAVFNFTGAVYHFYHYIKQGRELAAGGLSTEDATRIKTEREAHRSSAISYTAVGITIGLVALAGSLAVLGGFMPLAAIGIAAGVLGAAFCIYGVVKTVRQKKLDDEEAAAITVDNPAAANNSTLTVMRKVQSHPVLSLRQKEIDLIDSTVTTLENIIHPHRHQKQEETQPLLTHVKPSRIHSF